MSQAIAKTTAMHEGGHLEVHYDFLVPYCRKCRSVHHFERFVKVRTAETVSKEVCLGKARSERFSNMRSSRIISLREGERPAGGVKTSIQSPLYIQEPRDSHWKAFAELGSGTVRLDCRRSVPGCRALQKTSKHHLSGLCMCTVLCMLLLTTPAMLRVILVVALTTSTVRNIS